MTDAYPVSLQVEVQHSILTRSSGDYSHDAICSVDGAFEDNSYVYIVMEFVQGGLLFDVC